MIGSLRGYVPRATGRLSRWLVRLVCLVLILLQPLPVVGALTLPLMCYANFAVYRAALQRQSAALARG